MDLQNEKCVMVIDEQLPLGIIANTAAVMGITLGKAMPEVVGADVRDESGHTHLGIIEFPLPILLHRADGPGAGEHAAVFRRCRLRREEEGQQAHRKSPAPAVSRKSI